MGHAVEYTVSELCCQEQMRYRCRIIAGGGVCRALAWLWPAHCRQGQCPGPEITTATKSITARTARVSVNHGPDVARKGWNVLTEKDGTSSWIRTRSWSLPPRKQGKRAPPAPARAAIRRSPIWFNTAVRFAEAGSPESHGDIRDLTDSLPGGFDPALVSSTMR